MDNAIIDKAKNEMTNYFIRTWIHKLEHPIKTNLNSMIPIDKHTLFQIKNVLQKFPYSNNVIPNMSVSTIDTYWFSDKEIHSPEDWERRDSVLMYIYITITLPENNISYV